tara:strand:+ start:16327 stop:19806 length:3480 start_codon:yes stop_codon:yes gene_type:complete
LSNYSNIQEKLGRFIKKYYTNILLKGVLLFISFGALIFMLFLGVEYFMWLGSTARFVLFCLLIAVELLLLFQYILTPLFYLFKIKTGIDDKQASKLIGKYFPNVDDKLFNLFDLAEKMDQSELLLASIEQRAINFAGLDFSKAVNYKDALKVAKFLIGPVTIVFLLWFSGNFNSFFGSYDRVVNYNLVYEPPAPFVFDLISDSLSMYQNSNFEIQVGVKGKVRPESVYITIEDEDYLMKEDNNFFVYTIKSATKSLDFNFIANDLKSKTYTLKVLETPSILDFNLHLEYPKYIGRAPEDLRSVGNAIIPEGTKVTWKLKTLHTDKIELKTNDTIYDFEKEGDIYALSKIIRKNLDYGISTSNANIVNYENISYSFRVIKDAYPSIMVTQIIDSLNPNKLYFNGDISDDYGLNKVTIIYYPTNEPQHIEKLTLLSSSRVVDQFYYTYPSGLLLEENLDYSFYFDVSDNDGVNGSKHTKSQVFSKRLLDYNQLINRELDVQQSILTNLDKSVDRLKKQSNSLKEISEEQKEKSILSFNDKKKVNNFLDKQELQESQMQKFSKQLKENLNQLNKDDELNRLLQERLERQEKQAAKNQKLLEELQKVADKINKDELTKKLDEIAKNQRNSQRNLEQLLELTKRYYITEKASQLAKDLDHLSEKQELLSKQKLLTNDAQQNQSNLNTIFDELNKELDELVKDNQELKKPIKIEVDKSLSENIKSDQKGALEELSKQLDLEQSQEVGDSKSESNKASKKQKLAADQIKELSNKLEQSSSSSSSSSVAEDADVLRQILDNLVIFTFKQEKLMNDLSGDEGAFTNQSQAILKQQELRRLFEHIDDSLFSLSLRVPEISEEINKEITEVYYNTDKAITVISDANLYQGVSYQKYTLTSGNTLSDLLASVLDNMQESMKSGKGNGSDKDFQLPDIIKAQGDIKEKMGKQGKGAEDGNEGEEGKNGEQGNEGASGKNGDSGEKENQIGGKEGQGDQGENGNKKADGKGEGGSGIGDKKGSGVGSGAGSISEAELKEIYEIYKQQEKLKQSLGEQLQNMLNNSDRKLGQKLIQQMSDFQDDLLENGITNSTVDKATILEYELLKLEGAAMKQGKKNERESSANSNLFVNPILTRPTTLDIYKNENEILNRQALPLRQNFRTKIKDYFKNND